VLASLARTHRLVVVDEGWRTCSLAAEVCAAVTERGFDALDWPPLRVCSAEVPMPYAKHLEDAALPSSERIVAAVKEMLG
jgi:pyruvate/2-oxoglutarate/acetoin dehydrogenase E1 component